jgi:hypothetical protein
LKRWVDARRIHQYFVSKNAEFLEQNVNLHIKVTAKPNEMPYTSGTSGGRKLAFEDSSERRRRKSKELRKFVGFPELTHATKIESSFCW